MAYQLYEVILKTGNTRFCVLLVLKKDAAVADNEFNEFKRIYQQKNITFLTETAVWHTGRNIAAALIYNENKHTCVPNTNT